MNQYPSSNICWQLQEQQVKSVLWKCYKTSIALCFKSGVINLDSSSQIADFRLVITVSLQYMPYTEMKNGWFVTSKIRYSVNKATETLTSVQNPPAMSAEHELYTASVVYPEVCCLYTGHSGLDVQTYYRILSLFLSSSVVQSPPCTNTPEDYFAVDILSRNNMVYSKPLSGGHAICSLQAVYYWTSLPHPVQTT